MRKPMAALVLCAAAVVAASEGCAPVPLPHYAAYPPRRVEELLVDALEMEDDALIGNGGMVRGD